MLYWKAEGERVTPLYGLCRYVWSWRVRFLSNFDRNMICFSLWLGTSVRVYTILLIPPLPDGLSHATNYGPLLLQVQWSNLQLKCLISQGTQPNESDRARTNMPNLICKKQLQYIKMSVNPSCEHKLYNKSLQLFTRWSFLFIFYCCSKRKSLHSRALCYVSVKSKLQHPPPLGHTPGIWRPFLPGRREFD